MMNKFKLSILAGVMFVNISVTKVEASGFPVVDIASIVQAVTDYAQQLTQYAEMIEQTVLTADELATSITQYEQMVTDYEQMVTNLTDLNELMDAGDFLGAFELITDSGLSEFISEDFADIADELLDVWVEVDEARSGRFGGVRDIENVLAEIEDLYAENPEALEAATIAFNAQNASTSEVSADQIYLEQIASLEENLIEQSDTLNALGPESELATLQFLGQQLVAQQKIQVAQMRHAAVKEQVGFSFDEMVARKKAKSVSDAAVRMQTALDTEIEYPED